MSSQDTCSLVNLFARASVEDFQIQLEDWSILDAAQLLSFNLAIAYRDWRRFTEVPIPNDRFRLMAAQYVCSSLFILRFQLIATQ